MIKKMYQIQAWDKDGNEFGVLCSMTDEQLINMSKTGKSIVRIDFVETMEKEIAAWRTQFPKFEYKPQEDCVAMKYEHVRYGCHCDLGPGEKPDGCVFDFGRIPDCRNAQLLHSQGKGKADCSEWKPIEVMR